jgi:hypothetical protein
MNKSHIPIGGFYKDDLEGTLDSIIERLTQVRKQYGGEAIVSIDLGYERYSDGRTIEVTLSRLETDDEFSVRLTKEKEIRAQHEKAEHERYLQLKAKYEKQTEP